MKTAYGELIGGISGDMFVAALLDLGLSRSKLRSELSKIATLKFKLKVSKKFVHSIGATQFQVICPKSQARRSWNEIRRLVAGSALNPQVKNTGIEIFAALADAEAKIHGIAVDKVHFHEIGATDSIVDIIAVAIGIKELAITGLHFSPIPLGRGIIQSRHGPMPAPAPATLELLKGLPTFGIDLEGETVTPTGAAMVRTLGTSFGEQPSMTVLKIGYGSGQKEFAHRPNLFRLSIGERPPRWQHEEMLVMETNVDDMNPQYFDYVIDRLFAAGARDVFLTPTQMKKNRPATLLTAICELAKRDALAAIILQETTSIGVRYYPVSRMTLKRETKRIKTRHGEVTLKVVEQPDGKKRAAPEYDDLKRIAAAKNLPLTTVHDEVIRQFKK